jgi:hypothetical protein
VRPQAGENYIPRSLLHTLFITVVFIPIFLPVTEFHGAILINLILTKGSLASNIYPERDLVMIHWLSQSLQADVITRTLKYDVTGLQILCVVNIVLFDHAVDKVPLIMQ